LILNKLRYFFFILILFPSIHVFGQVNPCGDNLEQFTLYLYDSYGDGWYSGFGNTHTVTINGIVYGQEFSNGSFNNSGLYVYTYDICLPSDCYQITFNDNGWFDYECSFQIYNSSGNLFFTGNNNTNYSTGFSCGCTDAEAVNYDPNALNDDGSCIFAAPFCTDSTYTFPAGVNIPSSGAGPYFDCLNTTPNPAWYYLEIAEAGDLIIDMYSVPYNDIDFIVWGPYDQYSGVYDNLDQPYVVDCSYSTSGFETANIFNAQVGQVYIFLITNYSNNECNIIFEQTGGNGSTDCGILGCENNAGQGGLVQLCTSDNPINLFDELNSNPDSTGVWSPSLNGGYLGTFNPEIDNPGTYSYIVSDCEIPDTAIVNVQFYNSNPQQITVEVCSNNIPLYNQLGINNTSGSWSGPSPLFAGYLGVFLTSNNFGVYNYTLTDNNGCQIMYPVNVVSILPNTGTNNNVELCLTDNPVNLFDFLGGNPQNNGSWSPYLEGGSLGIFNPNQNLSGDYTYTITNQGCVGNSVINVQVNTVNPQQIVFD